MFPPDRPVTLQLDFDQAQEFSRFELRAWWANNSSRGTAYKLRTAEWSLSSDLFQKDVRKVATHDASRETHGNFGAPILFGFDIAPQQAKSVRIALTPQEGTALYLGELALLGKPNSGAKFTVPPASFTRLVRVHDRGGEFLVAGSDGGELFTYSPGGKWLRRTAFTSRINDIAEIDLEGDGRKALLLACQDATLRAVKPDGAEIWKVKFEKYRVYPDVTLVRTVDLDGDGKEEILVGCDNWRVYALDRKGNELWKYEVVHKTRALEVADLDGDGRPEILAGTSYMWATILDHQGNKRWGSAFGIGCRAVAAPLTGVERKRNVVLGIDSGKVSFYDAAGKVQSEFFTGDEIYMLTPVAAANGREDVLVASYNGFAYRFTAEGKRLWSRALPESVVVLRALPGGRSAAGCIDGSVCILSEGGELVSQARFRGRVADLLVDGELLRVVTQGGEIATLRP
jgi:hypothetical protein